MLELANVITNQLSIQTGEIIGFERDGYIVVRMTTSDQPIQAYFLRTTSAAPPPLKIGDAVLLAVDDDEARGYVLGSVAPYAPPAEDGDEASETTDIHLEHSSRDDGAGNASPRDIEISLPRKASDTMRLKGKKIYIEAGDEIQLKCGGGTILIDKRGKIVVRGTEIVSRARRSNKIKGASVAIN